MEGFRPAFVIGAAGAAVAVALMELASANAEFPLMAIPFSTSIVLVMGSPDVEPAQPRALIGGHLVASAVGLLTMHLIGPGPLPAALAVGLAIVAMHVTRTFHPPAGIDPLVIAVNGMPWTFLLAPVGIGALMLTAFAFSWHNIVNRKARGSTPWPERWW